MLDRLVYPLVALSGLAGLSYELLWIRALGLHFGTSTPAITTVVATFMAGLGAGNWWFGSRADRSTQPFRLYQRLELGIAVSGLLVSLFVLRGGHALDALSRFCEYAGAWSGVVRALMLAALMLVPATLMGGTLPVLARALARPGQSGNQVGLLYACNTLGSIGGALLPDFLLIPRVGLTVTAFAAAGCNAAVALGVSLLRAQSALPESQDARDQARDAPSTTAQRSQRAVAITLTASSGFAAMALEVLWSRTLQHWTAALTTSFAVLLALYLAMIAIGALATRRIADRVSDPLQVSSLLLGATGVAVLIPIAFAYGWRDFERALWPRPPEMRRLSLWTDAVDALLHASYLEALPCLLMGASFPFVAAAFLRAGLAGMRTGELLAINTLAGVSGCLVMAFVGFPVLGQQASYYAIALLLGAVAMACGNVLAVSWSARALASAALGVALALVGLLPGDSLLRAHFRSGSHVIAVREGSTTTAAAALRVAYDQPYYAELLTPGVSMSSTSPHARRYMSMLAHAGVSSARASDHALLICYGVGNTAEALLSHRALKALDVVDISREVLSLAPKFARARGSNPLADPRVRVFVDDGRHHLIVSETRYDVITAEPPPPNHAGVVNLYSREFYRLAASRLAPGGVITQWLPVFELSNSEVRAMIAAFVAELRHTALLYGYREHLILLGSQSRLRIDAAHAAEALNDPALAYNLRRSGIGDLEDVLGSVLQNDTELRREVAGIAAVTDDLPSIQYPDEDVRVDSAYATGLTLTPDHALALVGSELTPAQRANVESAFRATAAAISVLPLLQPGVPPEWTELEMGRILRPALRARPNNAGLWYLLGLDPDHLRAAEAAQEVGTPVQRTAATWTVARRAFYAGDYARALRELETLHPDQEEVAQHALLRAGCLRALGRTSEAEAAFQRAAGASHDLRFKAAAGRLATTISPEPF
ncbi:MAG TPA: fused MFS/spermidine synthase [Polyangiales bacterium]|nr:fused MFS/spermidine synthase [Polyangiales bacterium]